MSAVVALDVGGTSLKGAIADAAGALVATERRPTPRADGPDAVVEAILALAGELLARAGDGARLVLAVPGLVDDAAGVVRTASNLGWRDLPLRELARRRLGVPTLVWQDARAAALAEGALGAARDRGDWLLVTIGTGIGGAVVAGGRPVVGSRGAAGEIGHMPVVAAGPRCSCGRHGCLEAFASGGGIVDRYRALTGEPITAEAVAERAAAGEAAAQRVWSRAIGALATALAGCAALLDPELIVLGGGVAMAGENLLGPLAEALEAEVRFPPAPPLRAAQLGERAGWIGALLAGREDAGASPDQVAAWAS